MQFKASIITPPVRRVWRSYKLGPFLFFFASLSEPMSLRLLNSISSGICRRNTQFNMYNTTFKQQKVCTFKDSHLKCLISTNCDKFHRKDFAKALNRGEVLRACFSGFFWQGAKTFLSGKFSPPVGEKLQICRGNYSMLIPAIFVLKLPLLSS